MLHIAICDDEKDFVIYLTQLINQYAAETGEEIKVSAFYDGIELTTHYDTTIDLIFLDIQMKLLDGLRAAKRIRQMDERVGIIFLTTLAQCALEGYKYQAANYIVKPMKYARLKAEIEQWRRRSRKLDSPAIVVANDSGKYKIFLNTLHYVETFNRNLLLHTEQEKIICYRSMKDLEQELAPHGFVRCHTSYIVNLYYVKGVNKLEITLVTGETIPVSQPKRRQFMEQLAEYWGGLFMMRLMHFMEICSDLLAYGYVFVFLCMICAFLPMRRNWFLRIVGIGALDILATSFIYSNDPYGLLGAMGGFFLYIAVFHVGKMIEKVTAVLVFCPAMIAVNYLMEETGRKIFFALTNAPASPTEDGWTCEQHLAVCA